MSCVLLVYVSLRRQLNMLLCVTRLHHLVCVPKTTLWCTICSWHADSPPPFAFVTADQQIKPFGKTLGPRHAHTHSTLRVDDIPGSRPKQHCFATSPRLTNPLEPHYTLPHHNHPQPAAPVLKFIKNPLDNSDIPGAQVTERTVELQNVKAVVAVPRQSS